MSTLTENQEAAKRAVTPPGDRPHSQKLTYIYLTSVEHSGSTLLACLLDAHPDISSIGEYGIDFSPKLHCACGSFVEECPLWGSWRTRAIEAGYEFELGNLGINLMPRHEDGFFKNLYLHQFLFRPVDRVRDLLFCNSTVKRQADVVIERSIQLARILCNIQRTNVFVDSSKNPLQIRHLAKRRDIDFKMIGLVRDGRAVMKSVIEKEGYTTDQAIGSWKWGIKHLKRAMQYVPENNRILLRLEDLCSDPETMTKNLLEFADVSLNEKLDFSIAKRHVIGNKMRLKFDGTIKPHDESWKSYLSAEQIALFEKHAGNINRNLGYDSINDQSREI